MSKTDNSDNKPGRGRQREKSDNPVGMRILTALDGRPRKWLASKAGISESTLSDYIRDGIAKTDGALAIASALEIDLGWLLTGLQASYRPQGDLPAVHIEPRSSPKTNENPAFVQVDQIDLRYGLGASYADGHVEVAKRTFDRQWLQSITSAPPSKLAWATGDGDSMEPTIRSGEVVLIDTSADKRRFDDTIWAVTLGDVGMIKRLRSRGEVVELLSDNPLVPPQTASDGELHAVGRVIAVIRRL